VSSSFTARFRSSGAERARRHRQRRRWGLAPLQIDVDEDRFATQLIEREVLFEWEATDRAKLAVEAARIIERWIKEP
jgi:hypothetical protein